MTEDGALVEADRDTTWVTIPTGHTVGRFGPNGIDIHKEDSSGCVRCYHGQTTDTDWTLFVEGMDEEHGIVLLPEDRPERLRD
jgi:hypothetical protein